jgi:hypothetical protein
MNSKQDNDMFTSCVNDDNVTQVQEDLCIDSMTQVHVNANDDNMIQAHEDVNVMLMLACHSQYCLFFHKNFNNVSKIAIDEIVKDMKMDFVDVDGNLIEQRNEEHRNLNCTVIDNMNCIKKDYMVEQYNISFSPNCTKMAFLYDKYNSRITIDSKLSMFYFGYGITGCHDGLNLINITCVNPNYFCDNYYDIDSKVSHVVIKTVSNCGNYVILANNLDEYLIFMKEKKFVHLKKSNRIDFRIINNKLFFEQHDKNAIGFINVNKLLKCHDLVIFEDMIQKMKIQFWNNVKLHDIYESFYFIVIKKDVGFETWIDDAKNKKFALASTFKNINFGINAHIVMITDHVMYYCEDRCHYLVWFSKDGKFAKFIQLKQLFKPKLLCAKYTLSFHYENNDIIIIDLIAKTISKMSILNKESQFYMQLFTEKYGNGVMSDDYDSIVNLLKFYKTHEPERIEKIKKLLALMEQKN